MMRMVPEEAASRTPSHLSTAYTRQGLVPPLRVPQPIVFPRACQYLPMAVPGPVQVVELVLCTATSFQEAKSIQPWLATPEKVFWLKATTVMELSPVVLQIEANITTIHPPASIDPPSRNLREEEEEGRLHHFLPSQNCHK